VTTISIIGSGNMATAIASRLPTLQPFASELVPALRETSPPAERGRSRTGERR
jgi:pyrroline-5-carboxylate reductase